MPSVYRGAVIDSLQRLYETGTVTALDERQLLERFIARGDESAFEAILQRHGPMVLRVCRRVLHDPHDVDDAFQATFLILVKKAGSIRDRDVLGTWLHGVARRVAVRARGDLRRRRSREQTGGAGFDVADHRVDQADANGIRSLIDDELERLPSRYRATLILCGLEGQTHEQAAVSLGCPVGTIKSRLSRGRERLRLRLARRGLATPTLLLNSIFAPEPASGVHAALSNQIIRAARQIASSGAFTPRSLSAQVALLMEGVIHSMVITRLRIAAVTLFAATFTAGGLWLTMGHAPVPRAPASHNAVDRPEAAAESATEPPVSPRPVEPGSERFRLESGQKVMPKPIDEVQNHMANPRRALRIARLKHSGDWSVAPQAVPNMMDALRKPPFRFNVVISQKELFARDPNLIYYPVIYMHGRAAFSLDKEDRDALRRYLEPGGGTLFADAACGSPAFDAAFRRFVSELLPTMPLVPIPRGDALYTTKVLSDLSDVQYTKAAGGGRGGPQLEGVRINGHWSIIYSKYDIGDALQQDAGIECKGYTYESALKIAGNIVIYSTLP
jgi:RNA polymerase sigma factor (sigma-70 family)